MQNQPTLDQARQTLSAHLAEKGAELFEKYGPRIGWRELLEVLADRSCARYPCEIRFDAEPLLEGECAHPVPRGPRPEEGFTLYVHPHFEPQLDCVPYLALYQLVRVNYGEFASSADAEIFGAAALGLGREEYYQAVCALADALVPSKKGQ